MHSRASTSCKKYVLATVSGRQPRDFVSFTRSPFGTYSSTNAGRIRGWVFQDAVGESSEGGRMIWGKNCIAEQTLGWEIERVILASYWQVSGSTVGLKSLRACCFPDGTSLTRKTLFDENKSDRNEKKWVTRKLSLDQCAPWSSTYQRSGQHNWFWISWSGRSRKRFYGILNVL